MNRLEQMMELMKFSERLKGDHYRGKVLRAIRQFAVVTGDIELESLCDTQLELEEQ